jgi:1-aminocyclopropane-1-carboxylate deaminase
LPIPIANTSNVSIDMLMLNELHPLISGNKYFKLVKNIAEAKRINTTTLVSMGGAYSNHLVAMAVAAKHVGLQSKAYIRGEAHAILNPHLNICTTHNMALHYMSRGDYSLLRGNTIPYTTNEYWIPEGGGNILGAKGCELITKFKLINNKAYYNFDAIDNAQVNNVFTTNYYNYIICACGTGTTLAGVIQSLAGTAVQTIGIQVLKGDKYISNELQHKFNIAPSPQWQVLDQYHCGGYAKTPEYLKQFVKQQSVQLKVPLDNVYTGKMLFAVNNIIANNIIAPNTRILLLHSGGIL